MGKTTFLTFLALSSFAPIALSAPILGREECICQPIDIVAFDNSSLGSCEAIARDIQRWRALAFHSPYFADAFVDTEERRQNSESGHLAKRLFVHELRSIEQTGESRLRTTFDRAMRDIFRRIGHRKSSHSGVIVAKKSKSSLQVPTMSRHHERTRPTWPWEDTGLEDESPGRAVEKASTPVFLQPPHRYRILCGSRDVPRASYLDARPDLMLVVSVLIVAVWLFVCDMVLAMCRNFFTPSQDAVVEGSVALHSEEKRIYAYNEEAVEFEAAVIPAVSDL